MSCFGPGSGRHPSDVAANTTPEPPQHTRNIEKKRGEGPARRACRPQRPGNPNLGMEPANVSKAQPERTMSKRKQQTAFLRALVLHGDSDERADLQARMVRAERDEQCAWRALWLVTLLAVFSCCGLCYAAVLIPQFFTNSSHLAVK